MLISPYKLLSKIFAFSVYGLPEGTHAGFDKHRNVLYWNTADNKEKYWLVKWRLMCRPKSMGGLGILNTSITKKCLISQMVVEYPLSLS